MELERSLHFTKLHPILTHMHMHTDTCMHDTAAALRSLNTAALYISEVSGIFYLASRQIHHAHLRVFVASYQQISPFSAAAVYKTA